MFYFIYRYLDINFFSYITVRSGIAFFISFILTMYIMPKFIKWAKLKKQEQPIYELAPQSHMKKSSTPTMGGVIFVVATITSSILCVNLENRFALVAIFLLIGFLLIGFFDDYSKIVGKKNSAGLSASRKLYYQNFLSFMVAVLLMFFCGLSSDFYLPFIKFSIFDMQYFAVIFWALVIVASSNAVNLTDGLDGLAAIPSVFSLFTLGVFAYIVGHAVLSGYLLMPKVVGVGEITIICSAFIGALLAFLWFNCYPAEVFMGDSGSLCLGSFIGFCGIITKNEILLLIIGFVFVIETLSVILQVGSFKIFKKRIFLMAPIHHHFELKGWVENKIIVRFWIISLIVNIIALASIKIR